MNENGNRILILVGSPKPLERSASARLGRIVGEALSAKGWQAETIRILDALKSDASVESVLSAVARSDVVLLTTPLYVDSIPAPAIGMLSAIADHRVGRDLEDRPRFASILNCGFAEAAQNGTAQRILEQFAARAGFAWAGGISVGSAGFVTKSVRDALDLLADALATGRNAPERAINRAAKNAIPGWLYRVLGNWMWKRQAKKNGVLDQLNARPYV